MWPFNSNKNKYYCNWCRTWTKKEYIIEGEKLRCSRCGKIIFEKESAAYDKSLDAFVATSRSSHEPAPFGRPSSRLYASKRNVATSYTHTSNNNNDTGSGLGTFIAGAALGALAVDAFDEHEENKKLREEVEETHNAEQPNYGYDSNDDNDTDYSTNLGSDD